MAKGKDGKGIKIKMATAYRKLGVCAFILMILLSLGCVFYLSFSHLNTSPNKPYLSEQPYELLSLEEARLSYEEHIQKSIQVMLDSWFGEQKTKVSVRAQIDFTQTTQTKEELDVDNPALSKAFGDEVEYTYAKQTLLNSQKSGQIKQLSVAILIDSKNLSLPENKREDLRRLIEQTAGFDLSRGDTLEIIETSFAKPTFFSFNAWSGSLLFLTIIFLFALFGVVMTKNGMKAEQIAVPTVVLPTFTETQNNSQPNNAIDGKIETNALKKAQDLVEKKPIETMTLLRTWLYQAEGEK